MTVQMIIDRDTGRTFVLFAVSGAEDEYVSVVGSFNDWVPGVDVLHPRGDGTRAAFVEVHHPGDIHFRYLASGTRWFDDPTAHVINEHGSTLRRGDDPVPAADEPEATPLTSRPSEPVPAAAKKAAPKVAKQVATKTPAKKAPAKKAAAAKKPATTKAPAKKAAKKSSG